MIILILVLHLLYFTAEEMKFFKCKNMKRELTSQYKNTIEIL